MYVTCVRTHASAETFIKNPPKGIFTRVWSQSGKSGRHVGGCVQYGFRGLCTALQRPPTTDAFTQNTYWPAGHCQNTPVFSHFSLFSHFQKQERYSKQIVRQTLACDRSRRHSYTTLLHSALFLCISLSLSLHPSLPLADNSLFQSIRQLNQTKSFSCWHQGLGVPLPLTLTYFPTQQFFW